MVERDFAQVEVEHTEDVRPAGQIKVLVLTLTALAVVAGGFVVGFMLGQDMGEQKAIGEAKARLVSQIKEQRKELEKLRAEAKKRISTASTTQVGELTFYNELPKQSVNPEPLQSHTSSEKLSENILENELKQNPDKKKIEKRQLISSSTQSSKLSGPYYLQVGSFQKRSEAQKLFPKLSQIGHQAAIKNVELPGLGLWYRVYSGPFVSKQAAETAKKEVKTKLHITGLVVKGD